MVNTRPILCIELLKTFSPTELEKLEKILSFEYFNTDCWIKKLFKTLEKYVLKFGVFDNEMQCRVYKEVFEHLPAPKGALKKNERDWLNKKLNELMRMTELFLSIENLKKDDTCKYELLYPELLERKQYQSFNRHIKKDKKALDKQAYKGVEHYAQKYKIEKAIFNYLHQRGLLVKEDNLPDFIQNLDMYYALEKLELQITALSMRYVPGKGEYDISSMEATAPLLNLPQYTEEPLIILYKANVTLMKTESESAYSNLLNLLNQFESVIPVDILKGFYTSAANYCAIQIRFGKFEYSRKMFELYKIMNDKELLTDGNFIPAVRLKNVVAMGCRVEEYEWAKNIIEHYRLHIHEEIRDSVCHFNLGVVAFYQKDYTAAHSLFVKVEKVSKTYDINVRVIILKCLYEKEKDYNYYTMQAFRSAESFFKGNKSLSVKKRMGYTNFIKILIRLYRLRHNVNATKADVQRIKEKLNVQKVNSDKRWLLEKMSELRVAG